ncbi:MAG: Ppx/GppA family phosphatase [Polyangiaceae bacterium]|nr:Ppx/GppA family phosphatase [Polyangiaceae bacterium]
MARFAAIDIGSNAMRLRVVEAERPEDGRPLEYAELAASRASVRLGHDVFLTGALRPAVISSAVQALKEFRRVLDDAKIDAYRAVATSAMREAENAEVLVERAEREAGVKIEIIEGVEEARLVQLAVSRRVRLGDRRALLLDVGGGSTELTLLEAGELRASQSLQVGTVRVLESFFDRELPVDARHAELAEEFVERVFAEALDEFARAAPEVIVATGGTIDTLATLCPRAGEERPTIDVARARQLLPELRRLTVKERMATYGLREDRADTIIPAAIILLHVARWLDRDSIVVPGTGLRDGVLEDLADRHFARQSGAEEAVMKACLRLGRRFKFDERHGAHVMRLVTTLFDELRELHGLSARDRVLLRAAALLHDIGDFIRYEGHHKHSAYIVSHSDIMGVTPGERAVVASIVRYHRKGAPDASHPGFRELDRDDRARVRSLASLLRIADALDREHRQKIKGLRASVAGGRLRLELDSDRRHALETWTVARKAELFRAVFDLELEIVERA